MADFDPDSFLAGGSALTATTDFDPDQFLGTKKDQGSGFNPDSFLGIENKPASAPEKRSLRERLGLPRSLDEFTSRLKERDKGEPIGATDGLGMLEGLAAYDQASIGEIAGGVKDIAQGDIAKGTHRMISGTASGVMAPTAPFLAPAAISTPVATAAGIGASVVVGRGAKKLAEYFGATPEQAQVAEDVGSIVGGAPSLTKIGMKLKVPAGDIVPDIAKEMAATVEPVKAGVPTESADNMFGPGAAWKGEFQEPSKISIKNAAVDAERVKRGWLPLFQPGRKTMGRTWDEAMSMVEKDDQLGTRMVDDIRNGSKTSVSESEMGVLLHERARVQNERAMEAERASDPNASMGDREEARLRWARHEDRVNEIDQATQRAGTITARALQFRQSLINDDYTFAGLERRVRAAKGGPLTPEESQAVKVQADEIAKVEEQAKTAQAKTREKEAVSAADDVVKEMTKTAKKVRSSKDLDEHHVDLISTIKGLADDGHSASDLTSFIQKLALNFVRKGVTKREPLIDVVHNELKDIFPGLERSQTRDAISGYGDFHQLDPEAAKVTLRQLKGEMQQVGKIEDMMKRQPPKKTGLERKTPSSEERRLIKEVNELKKKGGFVVTDPAKQLKTAIESMKTRLKNHIKDLSDAIITRTPMISRKRGTITPDTEALMLRQTRDALKERYKQIFGEKKMTDSQRLKMAMDLSKKSLDEWEQRLANARKGVFGSLRKPGQKMTSPELNALQAQRDALKEQVNELYKLAHPGKTPEERALAAFKTRKANQIAELEEKLARGDFTVTPRKPSTISLHPEAQKLQSRANDLKLKFDQGLTLKRLQDRPDWAKAMDGISKWRRAFVLSWPTIFGKLTAASGWLTVLTPAEELSRTGVRAVLPGIAKRAPGYGRGFHLETEVGAVMHTFKTLFTAAGQKWKTGNSDIDLLYGKPEIVPPELKDYIAHIHGALKEPARQNDFFRRFQNRLHFYAKHGADITDPLTQVKIGTEAYKDAQRQIFMEDNMVADFIQRGLSRFRQKEKTTGQPSLTGKAGETFVRYELPIVRIPLNLMKRAFEYGPGGIAAGTFRVTRALVNGLDKLAPEEADAIMRNLSRGALGTAFMAYGYYHPEQFGGYYVSGSGKREVDDVPVGGARIYGLEIPAILIHNPLLAQLQIGATIRRIADFKLRSDDENPMGYSKAIAATYGAVISDTPFVQQMEQTMGALNLRQQNKFFGELMRSAVPGALQFTAQKMDVDPITGQPVKRKPKEVLDYPKMGIPGLRQQVPEKEE